jgi:hypothetical protein
VFARREVEKRMFVAAGFRQYLIQRGHGLMLA